MLRLWGTHHEANCGVENVYLRVEVSLFTPFMRAQQMARLAGLATSRLFPPLQDPHPILMVDLLSAIPFTRSTNLLLKVHSWTKNTEYHSVLMKYKPSAIRVVLGPSLFVIPCTWGGMFCFLYIKVRQGDIFFFPSHHHLNES